MEEACEEWCFSSSVMLLWKGRVCSGEQMIELVVTFFLSFEGRNLCLEQFMLLGVPLDHCGEICDPVHQL